jgi:hemolysin-activating ACP:hemolysin acyltransferase
LRHSVPNKPLDQTEVVPAEGIEPPTFGLQNRCSTAELSRRHGGPIAWPLPFAKPLKEHVPGNARGCTLIQQMDLSVVAFANANSHHNQRGHFEMDKSSREQSQRRAGKIEQPHAALGYVVAYLMTKLAFAKQPFGFWSRVLVGQINRGHYFLMFEGKKVVGFAGWALTTKDKAEDWLNDVRDFTFAESNIGDTLVVNAWAADSTDIHRAMVDHYRTIITPYRSMYFKRAYDDGTVRKVRLPVNRFVGSHVARKQDSTEGAVQTS